MDSLSQDDDNIEEGDDWARDRAISYQLKRLRKLRSALCIESLVLGEYKVVLDSYSDISDTNNTYLFYIWLDYVDLMRKLSYDTKDIIAVFENLKHKRICCKNAKLYIKWAEVLVSRGHISKACLVLHSALGSKVEPADEIRNYLTLITPKLGSRTNNYALNKLKDHMIEFGDQRNNLHNHKSNHLSNIPSPHKRSFKFGRLNIGSSPARVMASEINEHTNEKQYNALPPKHFNEQEISDSYVMTDSKSNPNPVSPNFQITNNFQRLGDDNDEVDMDLEISEVQSYGNRDQKSPIDYQNTPIATEATSSEFDCDFKNGNPVNNNHHDIKNENFLDSLSEKKNVCVVSAPKTNSHMPAPIISDGSDVLEFVSAQPSLKLPDNDPCLGTTAKLLNHLATGNLSANNKDAAPYLARNFDGKINSSPQKRTIETISTAPINVSNPSSLEKKSSPANSIFSQSFCHPLIQNIHFNRAPQGFEVSNMVEGVPNVNKSVHGTQYLELNHQYQRGIQIQQNSRNINNKLVNINNRFYKRVELIGRGGSSKVFKILSLDGKKFLALKKVNLRGADSAAIKGYMSEIKFLQRLKNNKMIINLIDYQVSFSEGVINMVLEYGEIDLASLCHKYKNTAMSVNSIRMYWEQMLNAVNAIHEENIIHSDLKPANFLLVEGNLKLIDFGIARSIPNDTTNIHRDYQTGTINYMAPEAISFTEKHGEMSGSKSCIKLGRASDVWSLGCILYQMVYGKPPFAHLETIIKKLQCIINQNHQIEFAPTIMVEKNASGASQTTGSSPKTQNPQEVIKEEIKVDPTVISAIKGCLARNPKDRMTIPQLLTHELLNPTIYMQNSKLTGPPEAKGSIPIKIITEIVRETMITSVEKLKQNVYPSDLLAMSDKFVNLVSEQIFKEEKISLSQFRDSLNTPLSSSCDYN